MKYRTINISSIDFMNPNSVITVEEKFFDTYSKVSEYLKEKDPLIINTKIYQIK